MSHKLRPKAIVGLALLSAVAPAASAAAKPPLHTPVPAGELQHTVTEISYPAATNTVHHDTVRTQRWTTNRAGRALETNITTGLIHSDCQFALGVQSRCWTPTLPGKPGVIHLDPGSPFLLTSWVDQGRAEKSELTQPGSGWHMTSTTTYLGRKALAFVQTKVPTSKGGTSAAYAIVDAQTYFPLRQEFVINGDPYTASNGKTGKYRLDEVIATKVMKLQPPNSAQLTMDPHPGATVIDDVKRLHRSHTAKAGAR